MSDTHAYIGVLREVYRNLSHSTTPQQGPEATGGEQVRVSHAPAGEPLETDAGYDEPVRSFRARALVLLSCTRARARTIGLW